MCYSVSMETKSVNDTAPANLIDLERYPILDLSCDATRELTRHCRDQLDRSGACELPGFLKPEAVAIAATTKPTKPSDAASENRSETKMFEVRKTKNLVPINLEDEIRRRAYELYQQRAPGTGSEADDWFTAEREVMQRYHQQSA